MFSRLEIIPIELLDPVLAYLDTQDLRHVIRCSKNLQRRCEPALYSSKSARNKAVNWGCVNGVTSVIGKAVSHGAPISYFELHPTYYEPSGHYVTYKERWVITLTLNLAAKLCQTETFRYLLDHGARLDLEVKDRKHWGVPILETICSMKDGEIFDMFFQREVYKQLGEWRSRFNKAMALSRVITNGATTDQVRLLLDAGRDPDGCQMRPVDYAYSTLYFSYPLSAAIRAGSMAIYEMLIERGARVTRPELNCFPASIIEEVPILVAAQAIPKFGLELMQACLARGADINHSIHRQLGSGYKPNAHLMTTPLMEYLRTIESWSKNQLVRPTAGVKFFLENGADIIVQGRCSQCEEVYHDKRPRLCESLLKKWGPHYPLEPEFFEVIKLFAKQDLSFKSFMQKTFEYKGVVKDFVTQEWKELLSLLMIGTDITERDYWFEEFLRRLVSRDLTRAQFSHDFAGQLNTPRKIGRLRFAILEVFLDGQIDVNRPREGLEGYTVLHHICRLENLHERQQRMLPGPWASPRYVRRMIEAIPILLRLLISGGADPMLRCHEKTAFELLIADASSFMPEGKEYINGLVDMIRQAPVQVSD